MMKKREKQIEERKKKQIKQIKRMERKYDVGLDIIEEKIKKFMDIEDMNTNEESNYDNDDYNNFDIDELIERPRINSVPKKIINIDEHKNNVINIENNNSSSDNSG